MRNTTRKEHAGFTRTELLVLLGVVAIFSVALAADLTQTRMKLLQQACAANMKQWGLAFDLYSQDYNGTFYYDARGGVHFDDSNTPLEFYFGTIDSGHTNVRNMRLCPARRGEFDLNGSISPPHSYQMPIGITHLGLGYENADRPGSPFYGNSNAPYWPNLKSCLNPSKYLMLIECNGNTLNCGGLGNAVSTPHVGGLGGDPVPAITRHDGAVNCLFGDFHVELVSAQTISNQDAIGCNSSNLWFMLN